MAGFKELLNRYKVVRNRLIKSEADYALVLRVSDRYANKACYFHKLKMKSFDSRDRKSHYNRAIDEIVVALDVAHFCRADHKNPVLEEFIGRQ